MTRPAPRQEKRMHQGAKPGISKGTERHTPCPEMHPSRMVRARGHTEVPTFFRGRDQPAPRHIVARMTHDRTSALPVPTRPKHTSGRSGKRPSCCGSAPRGVTYHHVLPCGERVAPAASANRGGCPQLPESPLRDETGTSTTKRAHQGAGQRISKGTERHKPRPLMHRSCILGAR